MLLRGPNPIYNYFWVVVLRDGNTVIPEFDLETGAENRWFDVADRDISKVIWYPFSQEFADKVSSIVPRMCIEGVGPVLELEVPVGTKPVILRPSEISQYSYYICKQCGCKIYWLQENHEEPEGIPWMRILKQPNPLECPDCGAHNEWYCEDCKCIVDNPILSKEDTRLRFHFHKGEARCPVCENKPNGPRGLKRVGNLEYASGISRSVSYALGYVEYEAKIKSFSYLRPTLTNYLDGKATRRVHAWDEFGKETDLT
jgi:hypothetical protein